MTEKEMTDELGEVLRSAIAETHAGKADFEMGVESDDDSGMSFRSDEGAEDLGEVPRFGNGCSANRSELPKSSRAVLLRNAARARHVFAIHGVRTDPPTRGG